MINAGEHSLALPSDFVSPLAPSTVPNDPTPTEIVNTINGLARLFKSAPPQAIPPPPQKVDQGRSAQVVKLKEEGNVRARPRPVLGPRISEETEGRG